MPEPESKFHDHPRNMHDRLYGKRLVEGDLLEPNDAYTSSNGYWEKCPCPGVPLGPQTGDPIWVRPESPPAGTIFVQSGSANPPDRYPSPSPASNDD